MKMANSNASNGLNEIISIELSCYFGEIVEILDWCALDGLESGVIPSGFNWCALDGLEFGVVPFYVEIVGR